MTVYDGAYIQNSACNPYLDWLYSKVLVPQDYSLLPLLNTLNKIPYSYTIPMDENRLLDGLELRSRFTYETGIDFESLHLGDNYNTCTFLEMMVALAIKCEENIMSDPYYPDRTHLWFELMLKNMGLLVGDVAYVVSNEDAIRKAVSKVINHSYDYDGRGGLFYVPASSIDMRDQELWIQLCYYLNNVIIKKEDN